MEEIFKQYGGPIITVVVIVALLAILGFILTQGDSGIVQKAFSDLITNFFAKSGLGTQSILFP